MTDYATTYEQDKPFITIPIQTAGNINIIRLIEAVARSDQQFAVYLAGEDLGRLDTLLDQDMARCRHRLE